MNTVKVKFVGLLVIIGFVMMACNKQHSVQQNIISVSILPQKYIVEQMLQDSTVINVLVTNGNNPATYSPTPEQLKLISRSSMYIKIGYIGFEQAWLDRFIDLNQQLKIVDSSLGINYIHGADSHHGDHVHKGGVEPHIWTSPKTMLTVIKNTENALVTHFPEKKEQIEKNGRDLIHRVTKLDSLYTKKINDLSNKNFLIFHPAYTYLARDYNLKQISIEYQGKEPGTKWIETIISEAQNQNIQAIFVQEEFDKRNAEVIAKEIGVPVVEVHPLSQNWELEMKEFLDHLIKALS